MADVENQETKEEVPEIIEDDIPEENANHGKTFEEKQAEIEASKEGTIDPEQMQEMAAEMAAQVSKELKNSAMELIRGLTPGFIVRAFDAKTHAEIQKMSTADADLAIRDAERIGEKARLQAKKDKKDRKKLKKMNKKRAIEQFEGKKEKEKFKEQMAVDVEMDYKVRRELQLAEAQAKIDKHVKEMKEKADRELLEQREYSMTHWNRVAEEKHQERVEANKRMNEIHQKTYRRQMDRLYDEWEDRDVTRTRLQVEPSKLSDPIGLPGAELGVFGTPMGSKEYHGIVGDGGHQEGLDDHDVFVLDNTAPYREYEDATTRLIDSGAEEARTKALYDSLDYDSYKLGLAMDQMGIMRNQAEDERAQIKREMLETTTDQMGPPRREPHKHEIVPTHLRKSRIADLQRKIDEYQYCIDQASQQKSVADGQLVGLSQKLAVLLEQNKQRQDDLDAVNQGLGNLPVVMGRNISKVPGNDVLTSKPKELMNAMMQQSKLVQTKDMVDYAIKTHVERNELDQQLWVAKQGSNEIRIESNLVVSRLAEVSEKMHRSITDNAKLNLVDAIKVFQARGSPLRSVIHKLSGLMPWWAHHDVNLSKNCLAFKSSATMGGITFEIDPERHDEETEKLLNNGVTLGPHRYGYTVGMIELPKNAMWLVIVTVSRQGSSAEYVHTDETDSLTVYLGASIGTLEKKMVCFNRHNPTTGAVLYDIRFPFRGDSLAYRFEFSSSSIDPKKHLAVSVGQFEEHELQGLELVDNPDSKRQRVLSAYVKMMRIDEQQGKFRETKLLEELVSIEESESRWWDSDIVSKVPQRYERDYFLRILKAEILLEQRSGNAKLMETLDKRAKVHSKIGKNLNKAEQSRDRSLEEFQRRKRSKQSHVLERGKALIQKRIEILDEEQGVWRHVLIKDCVVRWLDNGLTANCTHIVHEHNEGMELVGVQFEIDLRKVRWFESPIQEMDEDAMMKWRRQKAFEKRIGEIDHAVELKVLEFRTAYEEFRTEEERVLRKHTEKTLKKLDKNIDSMVEKRSKLPLEQREIKKMTQKALLDIKVGIVSVDVRVKPGVQAKGIATERWKEQWVKSKRDDVMASLLKDEQYVEDRINQRRLLFIDLENDVVRKADVERNALKKQIQEYKDKEKKRLMRRVKFDKLTWYSKAVPKSEVCEHLRTKAWGDNYAKGIRCKDCGKELSEIHHEESQMLGYGTGTSDELFDAIKRHRYDEAAFRFKDSMQLELVEYERLRMEKERRVMEQEEAFFYDFNDLRVVYGFDKRHAKFIKGAGIFRQGLQWTEEELRQFEINKKYEEIERLRRENLVETQIENFDPLNCIEEPPPTFRGQDEKRRANYNEFMFMMGRLHTYQKKIAYLKETRLDLLTERAVYSVVLEFLHKESYGYDQELNEIERDLDKTGLLLSTFEKMQDLWKSANRIMTQANRDKMKAEMKQCGVWDDVKEQFEKLSFLHDETLALLKVKFLYDSQLEGVKKTYDEQQSIFEEKRAKLGELQLESTRLQYCRPGDLVMTRFGDGIIRQYRVKDDMLIISLSFGEPLATVIMRADEVVVPERARQKGEMMLMEKEDEETQRFIRTERSNCQRERWAMQEEEQGLRELFQFQDLGKAQDVTVQKAINTTVREKYLIMDSANFKRAQDKGVNAQLSGEVKQQELLYREYRGPRAGRPKNPGFWWQWQRKKELIEDLKKDFLVRAAAKAEYDATNAFQQHRSDWIRDHSFKGMIEEVVMDLMVGIAKDTYREGKNAKKSAERLSGLVFPNPRGMQYDAYRSLVEVWKARKSELRQEIEIKRGLAAGAKAQEEIPLDEAALIEEKKRKRRERQERIRQKGLISEMQREDEVLKVFYAWELKQNLAERRMMKLEDEDMRRLLKEEEKARKEAEEERKKGYIVSDKLAEEAANKPAAKAEGFENRRKQLQDEVIARRRKAEDRAFMLLEDKAGESLREIDLKERLLAKMAKTMGVSVDELRATGPVLDAGVGEEDMFVEIPDWFEPIDIPEDWDEWPPRKQKRLVEEKTKIRERAQERQRNIDVANTLLDRLEDASYDKWREAYAVVALEEMESELVVIEMEETARQFEFDLQELEANIHRIYMYCQQKGVEELRAKAAWKKKQTLARKRDRELAEAQAWLALCQRRAKHRDKIKRQVVENCLWIDTDAISGFHQRFKTELLRKRLYWSYFRRILDSIITRAEIIASERKMMGIQEALSANHATLVERSSQMKERWQEIQRDEYMRMRKSVLNQKFFPRHRREVLHNRFSSWVRFFLWNRGHREAFQLRYELLKRQMDIDRQYKDQLKRRKEGEETKREGGVPETDKEKSLGATSMSRHKEHVVLCKDCNTFYLDSQNHSMACSHHTATFAMHCPRDCPKPGMTAKCASHRIRRWTCCDSVKADAVGCCRKYHTPKPTDAVYDKLVNAIIERDRQESVELDAKLKIAREANWEQQMMGLKRGQVQKIEDDMHEIKAKAEAYKDIKWA